MNDRVAVFTPRYSTLAGVGEGRVAKLNTRIQLGNPPFSDASEGRIAWGEDGNPIIQRQQDMRLVLALPKSPQPEAGYPLTVYAHGSGGEWMQVVNRGLG